jgi:hypothetical protein
MEKNHLISQAEAIALPLGTQVYVELRGAFKDLSGVHTRENEDDGSPVVSDMFGPYHLHKERSIQEQFFRIWALPQPPTEEEKAENPWPDGAP